MIKIVHLDYAFHGKPILKDINLTFPKGELVGIIGANGSGKTTLLRCMVGLYETNKKVWLEDATIESYDDKTRAKKIALMHQLSHIPFDFPCLDVVLLGRYAHQKGGRHREEDVALAKAVMADTKTTPFASRWITKLSGGEKQRVMFAKALVQQSPFLLLDEPTATLDIKYEKQILEQAQSLSEKGAGVIMSIHNIRLAGKYCKRLVLLSNGQVLADGPPEAVITEANLKEAYDVTAKVYQNQEAGHIDFVVL